MIKYLLIAMMISSSALAARTVICPQYSPLMIEPKIDVKVSFDKKTEMYTYKYKFSNLSGAKVALWRVSIESLSSPTKMKTSKVWYDPKFDVESKEIIFTGFEEEHFIKPGKSMEGFEIVSKNPPGLVKVYTQGGMSVDDMPKIKYDTDEEAENGDDESVNCPGWYYGAGTHGDHVALFTTGPSIANRVEAKIRIKRVKDKKWCGRHDADAEIEISPLETDKIQVMVFGSKDVDVNLIKLDSLQFGRGKAKPVSSKIIGEIKNDDDFDDEIKKHHKEIKNIQHLLLEFNLQDVDVKCDLDRALFLVGKVGDKDLFAAAKINPVACDKKTFSKEAKKNKGHSH